MLDDRIRQQLGAHLLDRRLSRGSILRRQAKLKQLSGTDRCDIVEAQRVQRAQDRKPLRVVHRGLEHDADLDVEGHVVSLRKASW